MKVPFNLNYFSWACQDAETKIFIQSFILLLWVEPCPYLGMLAEPLKSVNSLTTDIISILRSPENEIMKLSTKHETIFKVMVIWHLGVQTILSENKKLFPSELSYSQNSE